MFTSIPRRNDFNFISDFEALFVSRKQGKNPKSKISKSIDFEIDPKQGISIDFEIWDLGLVEIKLPAQQRDLQAKIPDIEKCLDVVAALQAKKGSGEISFSIAINILCLKFSIDPKQGIRDLGFFPCFRETNRASKSEMKLKSFLRGIDVNMIPATVDCEEEGGVLGGGSELMMVFFPFLTGACLGFVPWISRMRKKMNRRRKRKREEENGFVDVSCHVSKRGSPCCPRKRLVTCRSWGTC